MLLENITMADFKNGLKKTKTIIIPFGTVEEHGSHLPLYIGLKTMRWKTMTMEGKAITPSQNHMRPNLQ